MIELYYENYILINIEISNFEEIKKKYFDNEGNKIVLLNYKYSIQSPFEYFTPVMYSDPDGNILTEALLIAAGLLISGTINGLITASGRHEDESFWGAFTGGFVDGVVGTIGVATGLAIGGPIGVLATLGINAIGGFAGNALGQGISYGFDDIDWRIPFIQGVVSASEGLIAFGTVKMIPINITGQLFSSRFKSAIAPTMIGVTVSTYVSYLMPTGVNKLRKSRKKR